MSDTTLAKLGYPKIDKLCDASFIRSIFKSTKKDFSFFVSENDDLQGFFESLEDKIEETNAEYQGMIQEYIESISDEVNQFKVKLKEIQREKKQNEKEMAKQQLREEILREMEAEKKKQAIEDKLGIKKPSDQESKKDEDEGQSKSRAKLSFKKKKVFPLEVVEEKVEKSSPKNEPTIQESMDLGLFYAFLKEVVKKGHLIIKNDSGRMTIRDVDLDEDMIRIKVE